MTSVFDSFLGNKQEIGLDVQIKRRRNVKKEKKK